MLEEDYFVQTSEAILFRSKAQCPFIKLPGGLKLSLRRFPLCLLPHFSPSRFHWFSQATVCYVDTWLFFASSKTIYFLSKAKDDEKYRQEPFNKILLDACVIRYLIQQKYFFLKSYKKEKEHLFCDIPIKNH